MEKIDAFRTAVVDMIADAVSWKDVDEDLAQAIARMLVIEARRVFCGEGLGVATEAEINHDEYDVLDQEKV